MLVVGGLASCIVSDSNWGLARLYLSVATDSCSCFRAVLFCVFDVVVIVAVAVVVAAWSTATMMTTTRNMIVCCSNHQSQGSLSLP